MSNEQLGLSSTPSGQVTIKVITAATSTYPESRTYPAGTTVRDAALDILGFDDEEELKRVSILLNQDSAPAGSTQLRDGDMLRLMAQAPKSGTISR